MPYRRLTLRGGECAPGGDEKRGQMKEDTGTRRVSRGDFYDFVPRWSPDGTRLAFTSSRNGSMDIYSMRLDGSDLVNVSRTPGSLVTQPGVTVVDVTETLWAWAKY